MISRIPASYSPTGQALARQALAAQEDVSACSGDKFVATSCEAILKSTETTVAERHLASVGIALGKTSFTSIDNRRLARMELLAAISGQMPGSLTSVLAHCALEGVERATWNKDQNRIAQTTLEHIQRVDLGHQGDQAVADLGLRLGNFPRFSLSGSHDAAVDARKVALEELASGGHRDTPLRLAETTLTSLERKYNSDVSFHFAGQGLKALQQNAEVGPIHQAVAGVALEQTPKPAWFSPWDSVKTRTVALEQVRQDYLLRS